MDGIYTHHDHRDLQSHMDTIGSGLAVIALFLSRQIGGPLYKPMIANYDRTEVRRSALNTEH